MSTQLVDVINIKMYTVDKQYKNRRQNRPKTETLMLMYMHSSISVALNRSSFTADLVLKQLKVLT